jgi:hypothetical protein
MQTEKEIETRIAEIKADERLSYGTATVFVNAPLALIQLGLTTELHTLERVLGIPVTPVPIKIKKDGSGKES